MESPCPLAKLKFALHPSIQEEVRPQCEKWLAGLSLQLALTPWDAAVLLLDSKYLHDFEPAAWRKYEFTYIVDVEWLSLSAAAGEQLLSGGLNPFGRHEVTFNFFTGRLRRKGRDSFAGSENDDESLNGYTMPRPPKGHCIEMLGRGYSIKSSKVACDYTEAWLIWFVTHNPNASRNETANVYRHVLSKAFSVVPTMSRNAVRAFINKFEYFPRRCLGLKLASLRSVIRTRDIASTLSSSSQSQVHQYLSGVDELDAIAGAGAGTGA